MTNEEKAKQISMQVMSNEHFLCNSFTQRKQIESALLQMAQWKDAQYAELLAKIAERNEESKRVARQISDNLKQMLKINNQ